MSKKKKQSTPERPGPIRWKFDPNIPTHDFFETLNLDDIFDVEEAVENFLDDMKDGTFLTWEAVVCHEQELPLTRQQKAALSELINFGDPDDDQILAIDEIPRTTEPWYEILRKIAPRLLVEPYRTVDEHTEMQGYGWRYLVDCLSKHGGRPVATERRDISRGSGPRRFAAQTYVAGLLRRLGWPRPV